MLIDWRPWIRFQIWFWELLGKLLSVSTTKTTNILRWKLDPSYGYNRFFIENETSRKVETAIRLAAIEKEKKYNKRIVSYNCPGCGSCSPNWFHADGCKSLLAYPVFKKNIREF